jgi:NAD(P)-dependent dehydrogenase (short-subunit alcohol dehydrogenase family)
MNGVLVITGGTEQDVSRAILWAWSDRASFTAGTMLDVAGGGWRRSRGLDP